MGSVIHSGGVQSCGRIFEDSLSLEIAGEARALVCRDHNRIFEASTTHDGSLLRRVADCRIARCLKQVRFQRVPSILFDYSRSVRLTRRHAGRIGHALDADDDLVRYLRLFMLRPGRL